MIWDLLFHTIIAGGLNLLLSGITAFLLYKILNKELGKDFLVKKTLGETHADHASIGCSIVLFPIIVVVWEIILYMLFGTKMTFIWYFFMTLLGG
jgi:hypothetical protein